MHSKIGYKINIQIEDNTGKTDAVMFGKTVQSLINKVCSTLTYDEGYTDRYMIPPILEEIRGISKIFVIQFQTRGAFIDKVILKTFNDEQPQLYLSPITTASSKETSSVSKPIQSVSVPHESTSFASSSKKKKTNQLRRNDKQKEKEVII
ncbi:uncharacterized protein LOC112091184 [Morus notabilis]|uniref:uncharacterized protein LOC112091184 n=1 Tax=Morus notabilis TaxID=981085 RepID=UPI000CED75E5|nr:uncharacterized protein LOC112091184 [Morus notabilis]